MNENNLKQMLMQADAGESLVPMDAKHLSRVIRKRVHGRKMLLRSGMFAAAAIIMVAFILGQRQFQLYQKQQQIVRLEEKIEDLNRRTEQTLALVQDMLDRQEQQNTQRKLASYQDPIRHQVEEAAFILIYQADRMLEKYNNKETAIQYYNQVIERFGDTPSAQTARDRLNRMEQQIQPNHI